MKTWRQGIAVLAMLAIGAVTARADDAGPTVTVSGHATAPEKAQILRLTLLVSAQGSDIHDAAAKLKQERDDLTAKLAAIGVSQNAIKFSGPVEGNQSAMTPQQQMIQRMMMARNRQTPTTGPSGSTISSTLTAEWTLPDASPDDSLVAANELEAKIKTAIAKPGSAAAKTPEEQEIAEEMAAQQNNVEQTKPDEPKFIFVHKLTDEERAKLLTQAFADAQAQAKRLATAAGMQVGAVSHLSTSPADTGDTENPYQALIDAQLGASSPKPADDEALGDQPNNVSYSVTLVATFKLQ